MRITILRRTLWLVAAAALGYATFAFYEWRTTELIIAAAGFIVLIPIDMVLAREERERRHRSPFGPVRKWGTFEQRFAVANSLKAITPRIPWWRRMYRRITAPWWLAAWMPLLLIPAGLWLTPIVHADTIGDVAYISTLDYFGVEYGDTAIAIETGHTICDALDAGLTPDGVVRIGQRAGWTGLDAAHIVGAAIGSYCPKFAYQLGDRTALA